MEIVTKKIPDSNAVGELDPRVYEILSQNKRNFDEGGMLFMPESESAPVSFPIERLRALMGWANTDVTRTDIQTVYKEIIGTNGSIHVRIYSPSSEGIHPCILFFHGGGFIGGSLETVENPCKALAEKANAVVVSVDYRLAPEHAFPAGLTDCFDAVEWVFLHAAEIGINPGQITVCGDSAGGNLATVCAMMDRDRGTGMINFQALIYPTVNMAGIQTEDFEWSIDQYTINNHRELIIPAVEGLKQGGSFFHDMYLQKQTDPGHHYVSPLLADDLTGLPEALVIVAEYDYLRLEGEAYARKLSRSGVQTKLICYSGMDHAFIDKIGLYPQAEDCMVEIAEAIKRRFS
ncbi:alpha/beta hydrolase [Paenibacillus prosopidis]|uniref:Acetyl esterase/lipase n=1 Tax=Paenibacillus prosopidis TaxID=630520 RepID=A0A368W5B1_9BACL|nr:alpha/beta hydrolase [Paenibacillus prosopidis]RCW50228.1 acetyl esterase/lipase [Paenibacillus prosopidis]